MNFVGTQFRPQQRENNFLTYSKSPTYKHLSCELSKIQTCVHMSNHVSQFTCLVYIITCMHMLQVVMLLCTLLYSTESTVVQYLYFKPRMSGSKCKSSGDVAGTAKKCQVIMMETLLLRHRTQMQNGTRRLQQPFRMQSSATMSSMTRKTELLHRHPWIAPSLPPPLPPPVSNSSCLFTRCQPLYASSCTVLLYFSRYCTVRLKMFSLFFVFVFYVLFV